MLDQNTDRMWYVIGAVIVGAAIILLLNNTFPQLFASVGDTFKGKTAQTTDVVDGIMPKVKGLNAYLEPENWEPGTINSTGTLLEEDSEWTYRDIRIRYKERIPVTTKQVKITMNKDYMITIGQYNDGVFLKRDVWIDGTALTYTVDPNATHLAIVIRRAGGIQINIDPSAAPDIQLHIEPIAD